MDPKTMSVGLAMTCVCMEFILEVEVQLFLPCR